MSSTDYIDEATRLLKEALATDFPQATRITGSLATGGGDYDELFGQLRAGFGAWRASDGATDGPTVARAVVAAAASMASAIT